MPGVFVAVAKPPKRPASQKFFFSKKKSEAKINNMNIVSGAPIDRMTKNLGKNRNTVATINGYLVRLKCLRK